MGGRTKGGGHDPGSAPILRYKGDKCSFCGGMRLEVHGFVRLGSGKCWRGPMFGYVGYKWFVWTCVARLVLLLPGVGDY